MGWGIPRGACKQPPAKRIRWGGVGWGGVEPPKITKNRSFIRYAVFLFHTSLKGFEICQEAPTRNNLPICKNLPIQTLPIQTLSGVGGVDPRRCMNAKHYLDLDPTLILIFQVRLLQTTRTCNTECALGTRRLQPAI